MKKSFDTTPQDMDAAFRGRLGRHGRALAADARHGRCRALGLRDHRLPARARSTTSTAIRTPRSSSTSSPGNGIARVGDADVELGPGEVVFVPKNDYHGFENTGDEPVFMIWGYAGAASLDEAGYIRYVDDHPA